MDAPADLNCIRQRVREKSENYKKYNFCCTHNDFLKAFFDLAQEYDSMVDFYRVCVAVPLEMASMESRLYVAEELANGKKSARLVCDSHAGLFNPERGKAPSIPLAEEPYVDGVLYVFPISNKPPGDRDSADDGGNLGGKLLGMFAIEVAAPPSEIDRFFYGKYCNRIGYNLHNRLVSQQNVAHLRFINTLVLDIEHNVIVPNMYFKHLFNKLGNRIDNLEYLHTLLGRMRDAGSKGEECVTLGEECVAMIKGLQASHADLVKHHGHMSLFLESLFRREHFERGHLVLRPRRCFVEKEIIIPQLEHYAARFAIQNITVERPRNMFDEEFQLMVDIGLLAQVYANIFSNAVKYTREVIDHRGRPRRAMAYGLEIINNYPEQGGKGVKFNVFTTGPHLGSQELASRLFDEGTRAANAEGIPGSGHGLAFVKHVVELHGGSVGVEEVREGNNFYFILPISSDNLPRVIEAAP